MSQEELLGVEGAGLCMPRASCIPAVVPQHPHLGLVLPESLQNALEAADEFRVLHRENDLHAMVEVAPHQVGAAKIHFFRSAIAEIVDPAVFQETPHNAGHPD